MLCAICDDESLELAEIKELIIFSSAGRTV